MRGAVAPLLRSLGATDGNRRRVHSSAVATSKAAPGLGITNMEKSPLPSSSAIVIESARLVLRDMIADDAVPLCDVERDPRVVRYMQRDAHTLDHMREHVAKTIAEQSVDPRAVYDLAVILEHSEQLIGRCGMRINKPEHHEAMLWYVIHPDHWGSGYAPEAARAVCAFAFNNLNIHRVWADVDPRNWASKRVAEKLGMTFEGHLRENYFLKNEWCDSHIYAVLAHEFQDGASPSRGA